MGALCDLFAGQTLIWLHKPFMWETSMISPELYRTRLTLRSLRLRKRLWDMESPFIWSTPCSLLHADPLKVTAPAN